MCAARGRPRLNLVSPASKDGVHVARLLHVVVLNKSQRLLSQARKANANVFAILVYLDNHLHLNLIGNPVIFLKERPR